MAINDLHIYTCCRSCTMPRLLSYDLLASIMTTVLLFWGLMRQCNASTCNGYNQHVEMLLSFAIFQSQTSLLHNNSTNSNQTTELRCVHYY